MNQLQDRPDTPAGAHESMMKPAGFMRDLDAGTDRLREKSSEYLGRHSGETREDFAWRTSRAVLLNGVARTVEGLSGMVFRQAPTLADVPDKMRAHLETVDGQRHLDVFAKEVFADALLVGHSFIMVDAPRSDARTRLEEQALGLRPYWVRIPLDNVISWRTIRVGFRDVLEQVVLREISVEPDGDFGEKTVERYRVLRRKIGDDGPVITWAIFEKDSRGAFESVDDGTIGGVTEIPLVPVYAKRTGYFTSAPPLLDLAHSNVAHFRVGADHFTALHKCSVPLLALIGVGLDGKLPVGPNTVLDLPDKADVKYVEHSGAALDATRQQLIDLKADMAVLGLTMLQHETRAAETAAAKRIDKAEQDSALASAGRSLEDALENALAFHAQMIGLKSGGSVVVNRDFERLSLDAQEVRALNELVASGALSIDTLWSILAEGGVLPDGFDPEVEHARIEGDLIAS